ncbi:MAG TPA: hypothetical protein VIM58_06030 [Candidatus Methylacidiphilales bacterium]
MTFALYRFQYPFWDGWCYLAPAVFAHGPGALTTPLVGGFEGLDRIWGLHWPGVPLIESALFTWLPKSALLWMMWNAAQWAAVIALATFWAAAAPEEGRGRQWALAAVPLLLMADRLLYCIGYSQRNEYLAIAALFVALFGVWRRARDNEEEPLGLVGWASLLAFFFLPLSHPLAMAAGAALLGALWIGRRWSPKPGRPYLLAATAAYAAGAAAFALYWIAHPAAWAILKEHASMNVRMSESYGRYYGKVFLSIVHPRSHAGEGVLLVLGLAVTAATGGRELAALIRRGEWTHGLLTRIVFAVCLAIALREHNPDYFAFALPFAGLLVAQGAAEGASFLAARGLRRAPRLALAGLVLVVAFNAVYLIRRAVDWDRAGRPDGRAELMTLRKQLDTLPGAAAGRIVLPVAMWEAAAIAPGPFFMDTLPWSCSPEREARYEAWLTSQLRSGDLLLLDATEPTPAYFRAGEWEALARRRSVIPSSVIKDWVTGFDITVYRKR